MLESKCFQVGLSGRPWGVFLFFLGWVGCEISERQVRQDRGVQAWDVRVDEVWYPAEVPGCIHTDLLRLGRIEDPFQAVNEVAVQWIEQENWHYRTVLQKPKGPGDWVLEFQGLDTYATVTIGEDTLLVANNMHRPWRIPLARINQSASDTLEVHFESPVSAGQRTLDDSPWPIPVSNEARPIGQQTSAVTRKAMYHYGWDWGPRLATSGIWKAVRWVRADVEWPVYRMHLTAFTKEQATYEVTFAKALEGVQAQMQLRGLEVPLEWSPLGEGKYTLVIQDPELWWPNGMGAQPLYTLEFGDGVRENLTVKLGVRSLKWDMASDAHGRAMQCEVNGVPVQVRGANVIPPDFFPAVAEKQWARVVADAEAAHMNMLRVWGGAYYGDEVFYDLCDEKGILVWQDFMSACTMVPEDSVWQANFLAEAEAQVLRLRNRTSLALWCGNNESEKAWRDWGWQDLYGVHGQDSIEVEQAYRQLFGLDLPALAEANGGGQYWPSSPHAFDETSTRLSGDQHDWGVWFGKAGFEYYTNEAGRFASEFGLQSVPDRRTLTDVGVVNFQDTVLQFRQRCTMDWLEPGFDGWDMMQHYAGRYFADPTEVVAAGQDELDDWIHLTQLTQAEGLRQAIERHRCSKGRTAGSLYWQLDDVWPTVSWSTVDHAGRWKLAHHAVRHANQPVRILWDRSREDRVRMVAQNLSGQSVSGEATWAMLNLEGDTLSAGKVDLKVGPLLGELEVSVESLPKQPAVLAWSWMSYEGVSLDQGVLALSRPAAMPWIPVQVMCTPDSGGVWLTADGVACGVRLTTESKGRFADNGFMLLPGEPKWVGWLPSSGDKVALQEVNITHLGMYQNSREMGL